MSEKRDPYEVLGVNKTATWDEIKRVYRQRAASAHPDKGGTDAEMAELNKAFRILSNPASRQLYDRTGETERSPESQVLRDLLIQEFRAALLENVPDVLAHVRQSFEKDINLIYEQQLKFSQAYDSIKARRDAVRLKKRRGRRPPRKDERSEKNINLFHLVIDHELEVIAASLGELEHKLEMRKKAVAALDAYESENEDILGLLTSSLGPGVSLYFIKPTDS